MIERPGRRISATTRFYVGFALVVAIVVGLAFYVGYRAGITHADRQTARAQDSS